MHGLAFLWVNFHTWSLFSIELVKYNRLWNPNWILFYLRFIFHLFDSLKRYAFKTWFSSHEIFSFLFNQYVIPFIGFLKIYTYWGISFIPLYIAHSEFFFHYEPFSPSSIPPQWQWEIEVTYVSVFSLNEERVTTKNR